MEISTAVAIALVLVFALWLPYFIYYVAAERRKAIPGSHGGSEGHTWFTWWNRVVTPTLATTLVDLD